MLETSKDLLYVALAVSALLLTFFLSWALFYIVSMLKRARDMVNGISDVVTSAKEKIERLGSLIDTIEEKIKNSASYFPLLLKGASELSEFLKRKKERRVTKKKTQQQK